MRLTPLDMRDHFNLGRIAWRSSQLYDFYCRDSLQTDLSEIFAVASFRLFQQYRHETDIGACPLDVCFSNQPFGVKRFQTIHYYGSISLAGSCFSSESAPGPFQYGIRRRGGTIFWATLP